MKAVRTCIALFLLAVMAAVVVGHWRRRDAVATAGRWDAAQAEGLYWMRFIGLSEPWPSSESFRMENEDMGFGQISKIPGDESCFFIVPHPCAPVVRAIGLSPEGFHSVAATVNDAGSFELSATIAADGVVCVHWQDEGTLTKLAMRKATPEEMNQRWTSPDQSTGSQPDSAGR